MEKSKILIVEDNIIIADNIFDIINDLGYNSLTPVINYTEAMQSIKEEKPNLVLLDIQLSGEKTGIDIAKEIENNYDIPFIFLTSNSDPHTINEVKQVSPQAYILKPFTQNDIFTAVEIGLSNYTKQKQLPKEDNSQYLFIKEKGSLIKILLDDILFIKSSHIYIEVYLRKNKKHLFRKSLNTILDSLNNNFTRVHRSFIVNLKHVSKVDNQNVIIIEETFIPIGDKYKKKFLKEFIQF